MTPSSRRAQFSVYNTVLRRTPAEDFDVFDRGGNLFPTTILVIVSAVQKVARAMALPQGLVLYRGLGGLDLPRSFSQRDEQGCRGYADWGFMSTTSKLEVAVDYSGRLPGGPPPRVLEIKVGSVDRGAKVSEFSQYQHEDEYLFVPCSFVEQAGPPRLEVATKRTTGQVVVTIQPVMVNANLKGLTLEEHVAQKKIMHTAAFFYLVNDIERELRERAVETKAQERMECDTSRDAKVHSVEGFVDRIVRQCRDVLARHEARPEKDYADDMLFRDLVLEMLDVKVMAVSKLEEWLENGAGSFVRYRLNAHLRTVHRRWVAFLERDLLRCPGEEREAKALRLCKVVGLVTNNVDEVNDLGETRLMAAAAEGRSPRHLRLLVQAGAAVNAARPDGVAPMWLAAQFGHTDCIEVLASLNGDVNQAANDKATPTYIAAQGGNVDCIVALAKFSADVRSADRDLLTPLHQAALNGHDGCVQTLLNLGADAGARDCKRRSALDCATEMNRTDCVAILQNWASSRDAQQEAASSQSPVQPCQPCPNQRAGEARGSKRLIVSSGDISDIDGFMALAEYATTDADVLFVMNYPAFVGMAPADEDFANENPGLGFRYTAREVLDRDAATATEQYTRFISAYPESMDSNERMRGAMTDAALWLTKSVWDEAKLVAAVDTTQTKDPNEGGGGRLLFCIGGINAINPFSASAVRNDVLVYSEVVQRPAHPLEAVQGTVYDTSNGLRRVTVDWRGYKEIYLDLSGSAAFWDEAWLEALSDAGVVANIRGAFFTGGVLADREPVTMPSIPGRLNRFSTATINQLWHPQRTADLLSFLAQNRISTFVVTNNAVKALKGGPEDDPRCTSVTRFLAAHKLKGEVLNKCALLHYGSKYAPHQRKPFDYYVALALGACLRGEQTDALHAVRRTLFFSNTYGISCVGGDGASWETARADYIGRIDTVPKQDDTEDVLVKKEYFRREISSMLSIENLVAVPVFDLCFASEESGAVSLVVGTAKSPAHRVSSIRAPALSKCQWGGSYHLH